MVWCGYNQKSVWTKDWFREVPSQPTQVYCINLMQVFSAPVVLCLQLERLLLNFSTFQLVSLHRSFT